MCPKCSIMTDVDQRSNGTNHHPHHPMVHHVPSIDHHVVQPRHRRRSQGHHGENNSGGRYRGMFSMSNDSEVSVEPLQGASMDVHIRVHNSEQFWNGEWTFYKTVWESCDISKPLTLVDDRGRGYIDSARGLHLDASGQHPEDVCYILRCIPRCVLLGSWYMTAKVSRQLPECRARNVPCCRHAAWLRAVHIS